MCPGMGASSVGETSSSVDILVGPLYRFEGVMLTLMQRVTGWVDRAASPTTFSRTTRDICTRDVQSIEQGGFTIK
jgi:hypothetical protein